MGLGIIPPHLIRSFGRIQGRKLRLGQKRLMDELLPQFAVNLNDKQQLKEIILPERQNFIEIGFGYGEHMVSLALKYPQVNFIGCEPFANGVATLLKSIEDNKITNIRILHGDARLLVEILPDACIDRLFILFPDPWPKTKQHKKRIISASALQNFARILKTNGRLEIATDHVDYANWIAENLALSPNFAQNEQLGAGSIPEDWAETRYQLKAIKQGRDAKFFNYIKT